MNDPFAEDLARKGLDDGADPFAADLKRKGMEVASEGTPPPYYGDKPVKMLPPFKVPTEAEKWEQKSWIEKLVGMARGQSPLQTQSGIDETLSAANAGPDTEQYAAMERMKRAENSAAGMVVGGGVGGLVTKGLAPLVATLPGRIAASTLGSAAGGAVGSGTEAALNREDVGAAMKQGGAAGAVVGPPLAALGEGVAAIAKNAPRRVAEAELAGMKEGVQYKTRVQKFEPNEDAIRVALNEAPEIRAANRADPRAALPMAEQKLSQVADERLSPIYQRLAATGRDRVPVDLLVNQLQAAKAGFHDIAEESQVAAIDNLIEKFTAKAAQQGGTLPAQYIREAATAYQSQGFANLPMFGPVQLSKQLKQGVGNGLREAIGDHLESLAASAPDGKALRAAFESANRDVSTWYKIKDIIEERAKRVGGNATPMGDLVAGGNKLRHAVAHPWETAVGIVSGPGPEALDRALLPVAADPNGMRAGTSAFGARATNPLVAAMQEKKRREAAAVAALLGRSSSR